MDCIDLSGVRAALFELNFQESIITTTIEAIEQGLEKAGSNFTFVSYKDFMEGTESWKITTDALHTIVPDLLRELLDNANLNITFCVEVLDNKAKLFTMDSLNTLAADIIFRYFEPNSQAEGLIS